jgi:PAS domain S-box-containing protein
MKQNPLVSKPWSYQTELLAIASRWLIVIALMGSAINSLWFWWGPPARTFIQNAVILVAVLLGWLCLWLARRGHFHPAARLFVGTGFGVALITMVTVGENFFANGLILLTLFLLIGIFLLPARESRFWWIGAVAAAWLALTMRYLIALPGDQILWLDLVGFYLFSALVLVAFGLLGRNMIGSLNATLSEAQSAQKHLEAYSAQLQASESRYRTIFSVSPDFIYLTDLQGNLQDANPALTNYVGLSLAEMQQRNVRDFFAGADPTPLFEALANMQHGQPVYGLQIQARTASDEVRDFEINAMPISEAGQITAVLSLARDITERKQAQAAVQKRLNYEHLMGQISAIAAKTIDPSQLQQECVTLMAATFDVSRIYIFEYNRLTETMDNTIEWVAPGITAQKETLQGVPAATFSWWMESFRNNQIFEFEDIEDIPGDEERELLRAQQVLSIVVVPMYTATGLYGFMGFDECRAKRKWPKEEVQLLLAAARIIGGAIERHRGTIKLKQSEENYRRLFDNATDAIYIQDRMGRFLDVNQGAVKMYGYPKAFFIGKTPEILAAPGKNDMNRVAKHFEKALAGEPQQFEFWGKRSNGAIFPKIVRFQQGEYFGQEAVIVFAIDISEHKILEEQLVRQERLAAVGQLAAGIAHDFNNILAGILGYAELLAMTPDTPAKMRPGLQRIITSVQRAATLVRQILDFSGKTIRHPQQVDLSAFIADTVAFINTTLPETIKIELQVSADDFTTEADPTQLQQLLTNLAINARDAMPNGGVLQITLKQVDLSIPVSCSICREPVVGRWFQLEIIDTGGGIPAELLSRIFEPFFTTKEVGNNSGLGLSQVAGIVVQHHGHIIVTSRVGIGTTFTIYLPVTTSAAPVAPPSASIIPGQHETILLVEDEPAVLEAITNMLHYLGYQTLTAASGLEAITLFEAHKLEIALVLSDMMMPDMDGEMLFHSLKANTPDLKMIIMSGYPLDKKGTNLLAQGMVAWHQKPISIAELSQVIRRILPSNNRTMETN